MTSNEFKFQIETVLSAKIVAISVADGIKHAFTNILFLAKIECTLS